VRFTELRRFRLTGAVTQKLNFSERAVIMSSGPELHLQGGEFKALIKSAAPSAIRTRAEADVTIFTMCSGGLIGWWMDARARPRDSVCRARLCYIRCASSESTRSELRFATPKFGNGGKI
jgi:hypothetical protein